MSDQATEYIRRYRDKGILLDTNLLVLYFVGLHDRNLVGVHKRVTKYIPEDYDQLIALLARFRTVATTPHILAETSNLLDESLRALLGVAVPEFAERYTEGRIVIQDVHFARLGLTDCAIADVAANQFLVITDDLPLYLMLERRGIEALNFTYLRPILR